MQKRKIATIVTCACLILTLVGCSSKSDIKMNSNTVKTSAADTTKTNATNTPKTSTTNTDTKEEILLNSPAINQKDNSSNYDDKKPKVKMFLDAYFKKYDDWGFKKADTSTLADLYAKDADVVSAAISYEYLVGKYQGKVNKYDFNIAKINTKDGKVTSVLAKLYLNMSIVPESDGVRKNIDFLYDLELEPYNDTYQVKNFYLDTKDNVKQQEEKIAKKENGYNVKTKTKDTLTDFTPKDADKKYNITPTGTEKPLEQIIEENDPKTVALLVPIGAGKYAIGSGFFVSPGILVTNYHVIDGGSDAIVRTNTGALYEVDGIISADKTVDIAIVKLKKNIGQAVEIGDVSKLKKGENAVAIGSPKGLFNTVSTGIISNFWDDGKTNQIQISIPITHGNSGGPLFNKFGQVVGINSSGLEGEGELNFAISAEYIYDISDKLKNQEFNSIKSEKLSVLFNKKPDSNLQKFGLKFGTWAN
ncbi:S1C family serine protease [Clostridium lacusfryxellense]|uniref:S1C family serine protease n=1 Tax=Clostridium lacusfryxellense TaxID=205328 RepID=UPI001C0C7FFE|nr:S1C family serine protease [Clostridium lacusfryxellense]MBU3112373.1 S1C family serine protease [Clostridium lacusfryxellense]